MELDTGLLLAFYYGQMPYALLFLLFVVFDVIGGSAVAIYTDNFKVERLPKFLTTAVMFLWVWMTYEILMFAPAFLGVELEGVSAIFGEFSGKGLLAFILLTKYGASIAGHVKHILALKPWAEDPPLPFET